MAPSESLDGTSRVVPGRYPPPGSDSYADAIRERRGDRGLTPLDANLLHVPAIAGGYNGLMGAIRTKGNLPGDIREAMILRVAALNHAAFEWIQHEQIGRKEGLSTGQLYIIRDAQTPLPPSPTLLTPLQTAAVDYTDRSTRDVRVPMAVILGLKKQLKAWVTGADSSLASDAVNAKVDDLFVEAVMVVSSYNMVSRFLLATDVAGLSDREVPWPVDNKEHFITLPVFPPSLSPTYNVHAITLTTSPEAPWIVFLNSLLTDWTMWNHVVPYFLDLPSYKGTSFNILLHSQRGHGLSSLPETGNTTERLATIPLLAEDLDSLLDALSIPTPVYAVVGVSQGGAVALAFAAAHGTKAKSIVVCDTAPCTPHGNKEAWEERIHLVYGQDLGSAQATHSVTSDDYAKSVGMAKLAEVTVPRWFPAGADASAGVQGERGKFSWITNMITRTDVMGFVHGARALGDYNVLAPASSGQTLFDSYEGRVLLIAGSLDGGGKVASGLKNLGEQWNEHRKNNQDVQRNVENASPAAVEFMEVGNAGHLPMIDSPAELCDLLTRWIQSF